MGDHDCRIHKCIKVNHPPLIQSVSDSNKNLPTENIRTSSEPQDLSFIQVSTSSGGARFQIVTATSHIMMPFSRMLMSVLVVFWFSQAKAPLAASAPTGPVSRDDLNTAMAQLTTTVHMLNRKIKEFIDKTGYSRDEEDEILPSSSAGRLSIRTPGSAPHSIPRIKETQTNKADNGSREDSSCNSCSTCLIICSPEGNDCNSGCTKDHAQSLQ